MRSVKALLSVMVFSLAVLAGCGKSTEVPTDDNVVKEVVPVVEEIVAPAATVPTTATVEGGPVDTTVPTTETTETMTEDSAAPTTEAAGTPTTEEAVQ